MRPLKPAVMRLRKKVMAKMLRLCIVVLGIILAIGCSKKVGMFISANINPLKPHQMSFSDGYVATFYTVHKGDATRTDAFLFFVGGSGHVSHNYYLKSYFKEIRGNITIYGLQKRYVGHRETGQFEPSDAFYRYNYYPQLVQDQKEFIQYVLKKQNHVGKKVIIFGVSEGGNVAAQLACEIPQTTHLVMLGSGGMVGIQEFRLWGNSHHIDFDRIYQEVKKHPNSIESKALGQTYKYWASVLPVDPMQSLKNVTIPILVAIGGNDDMTPLESVQFLRSEFKRLNKGNLTVKIFPDCDHGLNDSAGVNHRGELFRIVSTWWGGQ